MSNAKKFSPVMDEEVKTTDTPAVVSIPVSDAERLYELFRNVESADAHFQTCQSVNFRQHVSSVYNASNIRSAFDNLKTAIDKAKGE